MNRYLVTAILKSGRSLEFIISALTRQTLIDAIKENGGIFMGSVEVTSELYRPAAENDLGLVPDAACGVGIPLGNIEIYFVDSLPK